MDAPPLDELRTTKQSLSPQLRADILALGAAAVPALVDILIDDDLSMADSPAEGWPPIHAVDLLAALKAIEAIEPMLDVLMESEPDSTLHNDIVVRLPAFGQSVFAPTMARLAAARDDDAREVLAGVLATLGVRDERIFEALVEVFARDPVLGAIHFGYYQDERALPMLAAAIADFEADPSTPFGMIGLADFVDSYERIAGSLPHPLRARVEHVRAVWEAQRAAGAPSAARTKVGRNDPCPCGSGKKFKKCCLGKTPSAP